MKEPTPEKSRFPASTTLATPAIGVCEQCSKTFTVPLPYLTKTKDAQENIQEQFDRHKWEPLTKSA
jgi:hypothetical protein